MFFLDIIIPQFEETSVLSVEGLIAWLESPGLAYLPGALGLHYFTDIIELNCSMAHLSPRSDSIKTIWLINTSALIEKKRAKEDRC